MRRKLYRSTIILAAFVILTVGSPARAMPVHVFPTLSLKGDTTTWRMSVQAINHRDRFPGITFLANKIWTFFILTARLTNTGHRAADLASDLTLAMRVIPPHFTYYAPGWTLVKQVPPFTQIEQVAARMYGGAQPWTVANPGTTVTYSYVIGARPGDSHYGLYQYDPIKGLVLLFPTNY